ncbi:MAG TPA: HAD hydrolase family protein, partial [Acholeplasmataceae bacterium]|nr:HAD hydrolase family protein [Acholeplasmataceae bacterium]
ICIATGRARFMLYSIKEILPLVNYFILINGRYILDGKQVVFEDPMSKPQLSKVVKDLDDLKVTYGFQGIDDEGISNIDADVMKFFEELSMDLPPLNKDYYLEKNVYQAWCFCTEEIAEILRKKHPRLQFVRWLHVGYDILPIGSSKSIGMRKLAEHLKIDVKDIVAFGDGDNDYELIRDAGLGIAMGNGTEKVKAVADYVTESVADDGIFSALKHFGFI